VDLKMQESHAQMSCQTHNKQLQRTVQRSRRHRERAISFCDRGAHHTAARRRCTAALCGP
jgi:hypothetical protein